MGLSGADGSSRPWSLSLQSAVLDSGPKMNPRVDGNWFLISDECSYLVANEFQQLPKMQLIKTGSISTPVKSELHDFEMNI